MNFTREPIIETVITPREGCKLVVRSSKGNGQEDYFVDAVEVVSFGHSFFFRSSERPKSFLVPVSDYEILELKETRMVLKNVSTDRSIKIGGGREPHPRPHRESPAPESREETPAEASSEIVLQSSAPTRSALPTIDPKVKTAIQTVSATKDAGADAAAETGTSILKRCANALLKNIFLLGKPECQRHHQVLQDPARHPLIQTAASGAPSPIPPHSWRGMGEVWDELKSGGIPPDRGE